MIYQAKEEDLKKLSRRGFLRMFSMTAASVAVAPTKTFVFFGDILRPRTTPIAQFPTIEGLVIKPEWILMGVAGMIFGMGLLMTPGKISNPS